MLLSIRKTHMDSGVFLLVESLEKHSSCGQCLTGSQLKHSYWSSFTQALGSAFKRIPPCIKSQWAQFQRKSPSCLAQTPMRREVWARSHGERSDKSLPLPTHLPRSLHIHKLLKNPMGLGDQFCSWPGLLELLTGQPEFQVLLAELGLQEGEECSHPICGCGRR